MTNESNTEVQETVVSSNNDVASVETPKNAKVDTVVQSTAENKASEASKIANSNANVVRKFEIEIYDEVTDDNTGDHKGWTKMLSEKPIIIEASCKKDLDEYASRLAFCHQRMKIVRCLNEVDSQSSSKVPAKVEQTGTQCQQQPVASNRSSQNIVQQNIAPLSTSIASISIEKPKAKPKYYKIGNIDIKDDNGIIYQKQWVRLSDDEASNFRIVNDKTNALVALKGKSIEMKKWIRVEDAEDDVSSLEENMND